MKNASDVNLIEIHNANFKKSTILGKLTYGSSEIK